MLVGIFHPLVAEEWLDARDFPTVEGSVSGQELTELTHRALRCARQAFARLALGADRSAPAVS